MIKSGNAYTNQAVARVVADNSGFTVFSDAIVRVSWGYDPYTDDSTVSTATVQMATTNIEKNETRIEKFALKRAVGLDSSNIQSLFDMINDCGEETIYEMFRDAKQVSIEWWPRDMKTFTEASAEA